MAPSPPARERRGTRKDASGLSGTAASSAWARAAETEQVSRAAGRVGTHSGFAAAAVAAAVDGTGTACLAGARRETHRGPRGDNDGERV